MNIDGAYASVVFYVETVFGLDLVMTSPFQKPVWNIAVNKNETKKGK